MLSYWTKVPNCQSIFLSTYIYVSFYLPTSLGMYSYINIFYTQPFNNCILENARQRYPIIYLSLYTSLSSNNSLGGWGMHPIGQGYPIIYLAIYISVFLLTILQKDGELYPIRQRYPIICLSIYLSIYLSFYQQFFERMVNAILLDKGTQSIYLSFYLSTYLSIYIYLYLPTIL